MSIEKTKKDFDNPREDFRLHVKVPFTFLRIDDELVSDEPHSIEESLVAIEKDMPNGSHFAVIIRLLNDKLDTIVASLDSAGKNVSVPDIKEINISAGGVGFRSDKAVITGETIRLILGFPPIPYTVIDILAEVIRCDEQTDDDSAPFEIAAKFQQLDDEGRQEITKFLFDVQRRRRGKPL